MDLDRQLVEAIKAHYARKSSAHLEEVARAGAGERWSPEAVAAAEEVLRDRAEGRAREPQVPEEDPQPLAMPPVPYSLGLLIGFLPVFVLNGLRFGSEFTAADRADPDLPVPFGPKMAWLAVEGTDTEAVAEAVGLRDGEEASWAQGIEAAAGASVFVTPPLGDWTLAVGAALFPPDRPGAVLKPVLERLSRRSREAQYFCTHRDLGLQFWARARKGRLVRGYGWLGRGGRTLWIEGEPTREERELGLDYTEGRLPLVGSAGEAETALRDEEDVLRLAVLWSLDPSGLDALFQEALPGLLGRLDWTSAARETGG